MQGRNAPRCSCADVRAQFVPLSLSIQKEAALKSGMLPSMYTNEDDIYLHVVRQPLASYPNYSHIHVEGIQITVNKRLPDRNRQQNDHVGARGIHVPVLTSSH